MMLLGALVIGVLARIIRERASFCYGGASEWRRRGFRLAADGGNGLNGVAGGSGGCLGLGACVGGDTSGATTRAIVRVYAGTAPSARARRVHVAASG